MFYISAGGNQIYKPLDDLLVLFNPKLTLEIGKAGSLEFDIPPVNPYYDRLNQLTTEVTVDMDDEEIFHGRVLSVERAFNNIRHVYCEGDLSYLIDSVQKGVQYSGTTHNLFNQIIANHNARVDASKRFVVGTVNIDNRNIILVGQSNSENINAGNIDYKQIAIDSIVDEWNNTFDYIQTCLIDYCGGYLRTRRVNGTTYIDLLDDFGSNSVQPIELGRNLLDLTEEVSVEDVFTVLIPLGDDNLTIASVNGGSDELVDGAAVKRFGRIVRTHVFSNVTNASTLLENARRYMATNVNVPRTINVRAVDLHLVNKSIPAIKLGDKVQIASYVHDVNDILTCTKIEYDLEHPDNNNYTFGNPKQTLTQRYREDIRLNNDTYGNSASASAASPSAASASAAAAAAKAADKEQEKALKDFYKTWIENDDETGTVSIGALYKRYIADREVLINQCGIDLDASTGNVNINSLHKVVDNHGHEIARNTANIDIIQEDDNERYQAVLRRTEELAGVEAEHHTEITQYVGVLGSQIGMLAEDVNSFDDRLISTKASIDAVASDLESRITQKVSYIENIEGSLNGRMATIEMWANSAESAIALKADKVYIDGELAAVSGTIDDLTSGRTIVSKLRATEILAGSVSLFSEGGPVALASMNHSHVITFTEQTNGDITLNLGGATNDTSHQASFNIANTKYFKDHVAAVDIESFNLNSNAPNTDGTGIRYETANKRFLVYVKAVMKDENHTEKTGGPLTVPAGVAWNDGKDAGAETARVFRVNAGPAYDLEQDVEDDIWYSRIDISGTAIGTYADGSSYYNGDYTNQLLVNVTSVYEAGKAAGGTTIRQIVLNNSASSSGWGFDYVAAENRYLVYAKANLSDNSTYAEPTALSVPAGSAWNAGKDAGAETARVYRVNVGAAYDLEQDVEDDIWYSYVDVSGTAVGTYANGTAYYNNSYSDQLLVNVTSVYEAGKAAGGTTIRQIVLNNSASSSGWGFDYVAAENRYLVYAKANLSDNSTYAEPTALSVPAGSAWNAGKDAGAETAEVFRISAGSTTDLVPDAEDEIWYSHVNVSGIAKGTYANGTAYYNNSYSDQLLVNVTSVYEAGKAAGTGSPLRNARAKRTGTNDFIYGDNSVDIPVKIEVYNAADLVNPCFTDTDQVNIDDAVNLCVDIGARTAYPSSVTIYSAGTPTWNEDYGEWQSTVSVSLIARGTLHDNTPWYSATRTLDKTIDVTTVYNAGKSAGSGSSVTVNTVDLMRKSSQDWYASGNKWYIPVRAYVRTTNQYLGPFDGGVPIQDVVDYLSGSGGCSGHVEVTSTSGNSAFIKIYDSSWNVVAIGGSSVGKWITAGTSETFG